MAAEWETHKMGDCCDINPSSIKANWPYRSMKYIDISSVGEGIATTPPTRYQRTNAPSRAQRLVAPGDSLLSTVRPNRRSMLWLGNVDDDVVVSTGFAVLRARPSVIEPRFLYYTIFDQWFTEYLITREKGAAYPAVSTTDIADAKILLPPLAEQRAIAGVLGALDDKIELNRRMNATLESMARALFQSWFVDFDPVRAKLDGRKPVGMDNAIAELFPDHFDHAAEGVAPTGWSLKRWGDIATLEYGKSIRHYRDSSGEYRVFGTNGPIGFHDEALCNSEGIVIGRKGAYRGVHYSPCPFFVIDTAFYLKPKATLDLKWAYYELMRFDINGMDSGSAIPSTSRDDFYGIPVIVPPPKIQAAFGEIVGGWYANAFANLHQSRTLASLRDTLLPKLLSGELCVAEFQKEVSA